MGFKNYVSKKIIHLLSIDELFQESWGAFQSSSGEHVSKETVKRIYEVYACVNVLAESLATLPPKLYKKSEAGREVVRDHVFSSTLKKPNEI